jgi:diaminopimelate epimerase
MTIPLVKVEGAGNDFLLAMGDWVRRLAGDEDPLRIRTWERGVEGETLSCGSGIVAAALVVMARENVDVVRLRPASGDVLSVEALATPPRCPARFTGPARVVAEIHPREHWLQG